VRGVFDAEARRRKEKRREEIGRRKSRSESAEEAEKSVKERG
jgi:5'-3' exonuclease